MSDQTPADAGTEPTEPAEASTDANPSTEPAEETAGAQATEVNPATASAGPEKRTPSIGRIVHYVVEEGEHRPAMIVDPLDCGDFPRSGYVDLSVYTKRTDAIAVNQAGGLPHSIVSISAHRDDTGAKGTWHWPETV